MKAPKTHNLPEDTRKEVIRAGREAAESGRELWNCPWIAEWGNKHSPFSQDDPRPEEITRLWEWAKEEKIKEKNNE